MKDDFILFDNNYVVTFQEFDSYEQDFYIRMSEHEKDVITRFLKSVDLEKYIKINLSDKLYKKLGE